MQCERKIDHGRVTKKNTRNNDMRTEWRRIARNVNEDDSHSMNFVGLYSVGCRSMCVRHFFETVVLFSGNICACEETRHSDTSFLLFFFLFHWIGNKCRAIVFVRIKFFLSSKRLWLFLLVHALWCSRNEFLAGVETILCQKCN